MRQAALILPTIADRNPGDVIDPGASTGANLHLFIPKTVIASLLGRCPMPRRSSTYA